MKKPAAMFVAAACAVGGAAVGQAFGYVVICRFVKIENGMQVPIPEVDGIPTVDALPGESLCIQKQFGVFDDAKGPAPEGGILGWTNGRQVMSGGLNFRNPGRLPPFDFNPGGNGQPPEDPFLTLVDIDATRGPHTLAWECTPPPQMVPPPPDPVVLGRNAFVSVWQWETITTAPQDIFAMLAGDIVIGGPFFLAEAREPDCGDPNNPDDDIPGFVTYDPVVLEFIPGTWLLRIRLIPAPGAGTLVVFAAAALARRRRRDCST